MGNQIKRMEQLSWAKFKALTFFNPVWVHFDIFRMSPMQTDNRIMVMTNDGTNIIDATTLCRFVTHIPGVGDLYEGDIVLREYIGGDDQDYGIYEINYNNTLCQWVAIGDLDGERYNTPYQTALGFYIHDSRWKISIIGNIHDPKSE